MSDIQRFQILNDVWVRYDYLRAEVKRLIVERDEIHAEVQRLTQILNGRRATADRVTAERDEARAEVERLKEQVAALTLAVEQADEAKAHAEAAAAAEEAETDRVMSERDAAQAEVERLTVRLEHAQARIVPPLPHAYESAQQVHDKMDGYIASLTTELHETREKLARVQVQYDEFAKVTAKVIDQHQRERDHARQQVYLLREAGADRPDDETIWREAFMKNCEDAYEPNLVGVADRLLALYRERWPR